MRYSRSIGRPQIWCDHWLVMEPSAAKQTLLPPKSAGKNAGRREEARQTIDKGRQPALGLLSKAAEGDRPPFFALKRGSGFQVRSRIVLAA